MLLRGRCRASGESRLQIPNRPRRRLERGGVGWGGATCVSLVAANITLGKKKFTVCGFQLFGCHVSWGAFDRHARQRYESRRVGFHRPNSCAQTITTNNRQLTKNAMINDLIMIGILECSLSLKRAAPPARDRERPYLCSAKVDACDDCCVLM